MKTNATRDGIDETDGRTVNPAPRARAGGRTVPDRDGGDGRLPAVSEKPHCPGGAPGTTLAINLIPRGPAAGQHGPDFAPHTPHTMKNTSLIVALLLGLGASTTYAQDAGVAPENPRPRHRQGPPGGAPRHQAGPAGQAGMPQAGRPESAPRPGAPLVRALDANGDHVIDATELANASRALLALDANGDGQLTAAELRPAGARGQGGPGGPTPPRGLRGPGGPGGAGPRDGTGPRHAPPHDVPAE